MGTKNPDRGYREAVLMGGLITAICPTFNRPELLGRAIRSFEKQTCQNKHLIVVDDLGQYSNQSGTDWQLVSFPARVLSLGEKNNICAALAPRDTWAYAKWDDDDIYLPWHLESLVVSLEKAPFVQPRHVLELRETGVVKIESYNREDPLRFGYHGSWGYTRSLFREVGGYRAHCGDDYEFQERLIGLGITSIGIEPAEPGYIYNTVFPNRISLLGSKDEVNWSLDTPLKIHKYHKVPEWKDESVWDVQIPVETQLRGW